MVFVRMREGYIIIQYFIHSVKGAIALPDLFENICCGENKEEMWLSHVATELICCLSFQIKGVIIMMSDNMSFTTVFMFFLPMSVQQQKNSLK